MRTHALRRFEAASVLLGFLRHALLWSIATIFLWLAWTGFVGSDDEYYVSCGLGWLHHFPFVAQHFGEVRAAVCIPIATTVGLLGESEFTVVLSTSVYFLATLSLTLEMLSRVMRSNSAFIASAGLSTLPLFAYSATVPNADIPELFFVAAAFWSFWLACQRERRFSLLFVAGVLSALAFSAHEVTIALLVFYGILFLAGYAIPRREYWVMALGFLAVLLLESLYYLALTADPLYRFALLTEGAALKDRVEVDFLEFTPSGTLHVWAPLDPLVMLFTHQHLFGLLGLIAIPALWWVVTAPREGATMSLSTARLVALLGIVWFVFAAAVLTNQKLLPRYYMVFAYCLYLTAAIWAGTYVWPRRPTLAAAGAALFFLTGTFGILVINKNPRFGERALVRYLVETGEAVHTDPVTAGNAQFYCRWAKIDCARIKSAPPGRGAMYFYNAKNADHPSRLVGPDERKLYRPRPEWQEVWRREAPSSWIIAVFMRLGLGSFVPDGAKRKLEPNPPVLVYRIPE